MFQLPRAERELRKKEVIIAIPASIVSDVPHLREKTSKIGMIGRAAAIFRVHEIIIYSDNPHINQAADMNLIATLLAYMEAPQYLRKRLFKLRSELRYAGVLPPLRTPHHPISNKMKNLKVGEHREGIVLFQRKAGVLVDIGVEKPALIPNTQLPIGKRVTIRITEVDKHIKAKLVTHKEIPEYWGYTVTARNLSLGKILKTRCFDLTIATSKYGIQLVNVVEEIVEKWKKADTILIAFGAPAQGLYEIAKQEKLDLERISDLVVNTIHAQGTETIRTEEALIASLAVLNHCLNR